MSLIEICLLCLSNSKQLQSIECKDSNGFEIKHSIELFLPGQMKLDSNIKPLICFACSDVVTSIVAYSNYCTNNIRQYTEYVNKLTLSNNVNTLLKIELPDIKTEYSRKLRSYKKYTNSISTNNNVSHIEFENDKKDFHLKIKSLENTFKNTINKYDNDTKVSLRRKRNRRYCTYCTKIVTKIENHLLKFHSDKKEVKKILVLPEGSTKRHKLMQKLIKARIKAFNTNEIEEKIDYGVHSNASDVVRYRIFPLLKDDVITDYIRYDKIIIRYANKLAEKLYSKNSPVTIRARLRLLGHFILNLKEVDPRISCFESILDTQNFKTAVDIALDETKKSLNCIYHMNLILKQILLFLTVDYFKAGDKRMQYAKEFFSRLKKRYAEIYNVRKVEHRIET